MNPSKLSLKIQAMPKAELHVHLEGSIRPEVAANLAARQGATITAEEVRRRYGYEDFAGFIEAFKWVSSLLREPADFAVVAADLAEQLLLQNVKYAEVTLSVGVMLLRKQSPQANFEAILAAAEPFEKKGLRLNWIFDAVRQFGPDLALEVVDWARMCHSPRVVGFGIGGDELSIPAREFRNVYKHAAHCGLHRLMHAGEIGGPENIREAIEVLGVERVGHGIAAIHDRALMDFLVARRIVLEVCPASNLRTGALARQLRQDSATLREHPLAQLVRHGIPAVLSTDDPAMFETCLNAEYQHAEEMGLSETELTGLVENGFQFAFTTMPARPV